MAGLLALMVASAVLAPSPAQADQPPAIPSAVHVARTDGTLEASWPAVAGADRYHVTYSTDGKKSWSLAALDHTDTSITFDADNAKTYVVGIRAGNGNSWGGWRNSPAAGPWTPPPAPATPSSVTVARSDGALEASWPAVAGATAYHVTYSSDSGKSWSLAALNHPATTIEIGGADNSGTYIVGVRARNAGGDSGWRNSPAAGPYVPTPPARPTGLTATAGDGSVTLTWDDPSDSTITGYEYSVRWAGVAWGQWTAVPGNVTTAAVDGLANGTEYRFKIRAVNAGGPGKPSGPPWYVAATPTPPLPAPANVAVDPSEDSLDITWDAVAGATSYDVRAKAEGASDWHDVASGVTGTSYTYATTSTMDYVAVRARSANGASAWTEASRLPPDDLLPIATGGASAQSGATAQSGGSIASQLAAPTWGTITRVFAGSWDVALKLNWTGSSGATGYNLVCSSYGWYWYMCGWDDNDTVKYTTVPSGESQPVKVTHYRRGSGGSVPPGDHTLDVRRPHTVAIRAVNGNPSQKSAWVSTPRISPLVGDLGKVSYTRTDGQISLSWKPDYWATGYDIYCDTYTPNVPYDPDYTLCATLSNVDRTDASHGVTITSWTDDGTDYAIDNTSIYDIIIYSKDQWTKAGWYAPLIHPIPTLGVSAVSSSGATLTLTGHNTAWHYKADAAPDNTCQGPVTAGTSTEDLTGLTAGTTYTYEAYSDSTCTTANKLATATFTTLVSLAASKVAVTTATLTIAGHSDAWYYSANAAPDNTCQGPVTAGTTTKDLTGLSAGTTYTYTAYSDSACTTANKLATATAFTTGVSVSNLAEADYGSGNPIAATYAQEFTTGSAPGGYTLRSVTLDFATGATPTVTVSIRARQSNGNPGTTALATLTGTVANGETTFTCSSGCDLDASTPYFVHVSSSATGTHFIRTTQSKNQALQPAANGWAIGDVIHHFTSGAWATYSTYVLQVGVQADYAPSLTASSVTATGATLTIAYHHGDWYYKPDTGHGALCQGPVSGTSVTLSGLRGATSYPYSAYSDIPCDAPNKLAVTAFTTSGVGVSSLANTRNATEFVGKVGDNAGKVAAQFTVGSNSGGYDLSSATIKINEATPITGTPGDLTVAIYSNDNNNKPNALQTTLSGSNPTGAGGEYTYTCSSNCTLTANGKYHLVLEAPNASANSFYEWDTSASSGWVSVPTNNGWTIGESFYHRNGVWGDITSYLMFQVSATANSG